MKFFLFVACGLLLHQNKNSLISSIWILKIANGCNDSLKFKSNGVVLQYDCELNYTFHNSYKIYNDTLLISEKDDSHSEDNGKVTFYRAKFLVKNDALYDIEHGELVNGKWKNVTIKRDNNNRYKRSSWIKVTVAKGIKQNIPKLLSSNKPLT